jgi:hypothetical protein
MPSQKELFISAPVLAHWNPDLDTVVECNCSGYALGATLSQFDEKGRLRPVTYFLRKLKPEECNYEIHDKELLTVVKSVEQFAKPFKSLPTTKTYGSL